jgi:carboxypeptidase family protein
MIDRIRNFAQLIAVIAAVPCAVHAQADTQVDAQHGSIAGRVTINGTDIPIGYVVIAIRSTRYELFSEADGAFFIQNLPLGRITLTAKRIGFTPLDTTVEITAGPTVQLSLKLSMVAARLPAIHSLAQKCEHLGDTTAKVSLELATLFEQVKQNADRHRLLSQSYPFELTVERRITKPEPALEARFVAYDTVRVSSVRKWRYAPGKMLGTREYGPGVFGGKWLTITMPDLADFADQNFLNNHCFDFGGVEQVEGDSLLRIEFIPAPTVREPDVDGSLFLDPHTYQIRFALMNVVNPNKQMRQTTGGQSIRAKFSEIMPGVPVLDVVTSFVFAPDDPKAPSREPSTETQRTLGVKFLKGQP